MDISKDGRLLLTCSDLYNIGIYDLTTLQKIWEYEDHEEVIEVHWVVAPSVFLVVTVGNVRMVDLFLEFETD